MARYRNGAEGVEAARYSGPNFDQIESVAGADVEFRGGSLIVPTVDGPFHDPRCRYCRAFFFERVQAAEREYYERHVARVKQHDVTFAACQTCPWAGPDRVTAEEAISDMTGHEVDMMQHQQQEWMGQIVCSVCYFMPQPGATKPWPWPCPSVILEHRMAMVPDGEVTRGIETREESHALSRAAELIADEYHDDTKGGDCIAKGLNKRDAEAEVEHHNYVEGLEIENERLRKALNNAAGTGLMIYHIAKGHNGRARDCQDIGCGLERNTMEGFVQGPIIWGD